MQIISKIMKKRKKISWLKVSKFLTRCSKREETLNNSNNSIIMLINSMMIKIMMMGRIIDKIHDISKNHLMMRLSQEIVIRNKMKKLRMKKIKAI